MRACECVCEHTCVCACVCVCVLLNISTSCPFPATAEQEEDQCNFEGCTRPKYVEGSIKYDYCSKEHAVNDSELSFA